MGITVELVGSVFSRNRSFGTQDSNVARSNVIDKKRWSSVRSYLCGDEFNSVVAEEDSTSVKSWEATVTRPIPEGLRDQGENKSDESKPNISDEKNNSISRLFHEEDAAMVIQSAIRHFPDRRQNAEIKTKDDNQEALTGNESPSRESIGTSIEVQTGNSLEVFSAQEASKAVHRRVQQKPKAQVSRIKLRICSKRKQAKPDGTEQNISWSWVERWMATRVPQSPLVENNSSKQFEAVGNKRRFVVRKGIIDAAGDEKESCGSNEVSVQQESLSVTTPKEKDDYRPSKNTSISRRKLVPSY